MTKEQKVMGQLCEVLDTNRISPSDALGILNSVVYGISESCFGLDTAQRYDELQCELIINLGLGGGGHEQN